MFESLLNEINKMFPNEGLLTLEQVCNFLQCEKHTIYGWTKKAYSGRPLPRIAIGKTIRFPKIEFIRWLSEEKFRGV